MKTVTTLISIVLSICLSLSCKTKIENSKTINDTVSEGYKLYELKNKNNIKVVITNLGGRIVSWEIPDKNGKIEDIVLGHDTISNFLKGEVYFGALIGRYGNRIKNGQFSLNGVNYQVPVNNGNNSLHGGVNGFHTVLWDADFVNSENGESLVLSYLSKDGEEGYPGNLKVTMTYTLTDSNELMMEYYAVTDKTTVINLTNHAFFNLAGHGNGTILNHELYINSDQITPVDDELIPTGEFQNVKDTPFDFNEPTPIGSRIREVNKQLEYGLGYDHNFVLNKEPNTLSLAARVSEPVSGRTMEVYTTEPGLQFYSGNFLNSSDIGKDGKVYHYRSAFCLETQHFPDSPNQDNFPSTVLKPGEEYRSLSIYKFIN